MRFFGNSDGGSRIGVPVIVNATWRVLQIIAGIVVIAYYASDVNGHTKPLKYDRSKFVFGMVVGILGTISAAVYLAAGFIMGYNKMAFGFVWEWILTILWAAVAGLFSSMYLNYHPTVIGGGDGGVGRERTAAGFDLANLILWGFSAIAATAMFFMRSRRSLHTGRASV